MKRILKVCSILTILMAGPALAQDEAPISIEYGFKSASGMPITFFDVQALTKSVTITGFKVNEGNCAILEVDAIGNPVLPFTLKYGQTKRVLAYSTCKALKVDVSSDQGEWTLKFGN